MPMTTNESMHECITQQIEVVQDRILHLQHITEEMSLVMMLQIHLRNLISHAQCLGKVHLLLKEYNLSLFQYDQESRDIYQTISDSEASEEVNDTILPRIFRGHTEEVERLTNTAHTISTEILGGCEYLAPVEDDVSRFWRKVRTYCMKLTGLHLLCKNRLEEMKQLRDTLCTSGSLTTPPPTDESQ